MAVQFHVAFSKTIMGAGITAGGVPVICTASSTTFQLLFQLLFPLLFFSPSFFVFCSGPFFCAQDNLLIAMSTCMNQPQDISVEKLVDNTYATAATGTIDPPEEMKGDGVFLISGTNDSIIVPGEGGAGVEWSSIHLSFLSPLPPSLHSLPPSLPPSLHPSIPSLPPSFPGVMKKLEAYYSSFGTRIQTEFSIRAEHSQVYIYLYIYTCAIYILIHKHNQYN